MKFGVFYELCPARPLGAGQRVEAVPHAPRRVELADQLGYDYAWW